MLTHTHRVQLDMTTWSRLWPLLAVALLQLWALTGHGMHDLGGWMAIIHVVFLVAAMAFLAAALTITLRGSVIVRAAPPARSSLPAFEPRSHTPEADSPPPRQPVRD
ncbi:MAG: hypothetical protein JXR43_10940 [Burkholderiaceae bacterium]|nr:hypothetical protein [Burkholderiaceae bacterium]